MAPTDECRHFHFCYCCTIDCGESIDVLFIIDSSSSISDESLFGTGKQMGLMDQLAHSLQVHFPRDKKSKVGGIMFATRVDTENRVPIQHFDDLSEAAYEFMDMAEDENDQRRLSGSTFIQTAMQKGLSMWTHDPLQGNIIDPMRNQWTIILTDGEPTGNQKPCDEVPHYMDFGIKIAMIGIGDASNGFNDTNEVYNCVKSAGQTVGYQDFTSALAPRTGAIDSIFRHISFCPNTTVRTPYDGYYSRINCDAKTQAKFEADPDCPGCPCCRHCKPVYISTNNFILTWQYSGSHATLPHLQLEHESNGHWEFYDPAHVLGRMLSTSYQAQIYPTGLGNWTYLNFSRQSRASGSWRGWDETIHNYTCPVICKTTPMPTRYPSVAPTRTPSGTPTTTPTNPPTSTQPTGTPSTTPTKNPTSQVPTRTPSTTPTPPPSHEQPTGSPTTPYPTVQPIPTPEPTPAPSSEVPTKSPTRNPTTETPTSSPTTEIPTEHPSPEPTSQEPTRVPTGTPSGTPSNHPTSNVPTCSPTAYPSMPPSTPPTICVCDWDCPDNLELALNYCVDYRDGEAIDDCDVKVNGDLTTCDNCERADVEEIRAGLNILANDVEKFEACEAVNQNAISQVASVSADIDALVFTLIADDTKYWQDAYDQYTMECKYFPNRFCASIRSGSNAAVCQACNDECIPVGDVCNPEFAG